MGVTEDKALDLNSERQRTISCAFVVVCRVCRRLTAVTDVTDFDELPIV